MQKAEFAAFARRHHRWLDLSQASKGELDRRTMRRHVSDAEAEWDSIFKRRGDAVRSSATTDREYEIAWGRFELELADWHHRFDPLFPSRQEASATMTNVVPFDHRREDPVPAAPLPDLVQSSAEFVRGFIPPDYLVDGVLQRRFFYSLTAQTGAGKTAISMLIAAHVSTGRRLGQLDVQKGAVIYFAGENPTDIQMRWLGITRELAIDPATADVHFVAGAMPLSEVAERITAEVVRKGIQAALIIVDTSAAYFETDDENSNAQAVTHARRLRSLTMLPGGPCVLVNCHPTKRAADDDLIPRGGGAFLAEVDGNIAARKVEILVVASAQGKFRGAEFPPLNFELRTVTHPALKDTRGRLVPTVIARAVDDVGRQNIEASGRRDEDTVLRAIDKSPNAGLSDLARQLGWLMRNGEPHHTKVRRALQRLQKEKLVVETRGRWKLSAAGEKELNGMDRSSSTG